MFKLTKTQRKQRRSEAKQDKLTTPEQSVKFANGHDYIERILARCTVHRSI
jgi:hypothetical protein